MSPPRFHDALAEVTIQTLRDMTIRWSFRRGDFLLWFRRGTFPFGHEEARVMDMWQMVDGAHATITNRRQDFPGWFDLHPTEVCNSLIPWMMQKVTVGDHPEQPIDGPNIWRLNTGDRAIWVGSSRPFTTAIGSILGILVCAPVAILGEHPDGPLGFMETEEGPEGIALCRQAVEVEGAIGVPRSLAASGTWTIG